MTLLKKRLEICEIFKNTFFKKTLRVTGFGNNSNRQNTRIDQWYKYCNDT